MKKNLLPLLLFILLASCGKSDEQKANDLVGIWLNGKLHDFSSYELVETKINSAFYSGLTDTTIMGLTEQFLMVKDEYVLKSDEAKSVLAKMKELAEKNYSAYNKSQFQWNYKRLDELAIECAACVMAGTDLDAKIRGNLSQLDSAYIGWYVEHTFRSKNPLGNYVIQHYRFLTDPEFTEIRQYWNLNDEGDRRILALHNVYFKQDKMRYFHGDPVEFSSNDIALGKRDW